MFATASWHVRTRTSSRHSSDCVPQVASVVRNGFCPQAMRAENSADASIDASGVFRSLTVWPLYSVQNVSDDGVWHPAVGARVAREGKQKAVWR